jgi:hypothetical protein
MHGCSDWVGARYFGSEVVDIGAFLCFFDWVERPLFVLHTAFLNMAVLEMFNLKERFFL